MTFFRRKINMDEKRKIAFLNLPAPIREAIYKEGWTHADITPKTKGVIEVRFLTADVPLPITTLWEDDPSP